MHSGGKRKRQHENEEEVTHEGTKRRKLTDAELYQKLGIDPANIVSGRRTRRAVEKYVHPDMDILYKDVPEEEREYALGDAPTDEEAEEGVLSDDDEEDDDDVSHVSGIEDDGEDDDDEASYVPDDEEEEEEDEDDDEGIVDETLATEDEDDGDESDENNEEEQRPMSEDP